MSDFTPSVTMDPSVYLRSSWRDPIGALLNNRRITEYARLGRYGKAMKDSVDRKRGLRPCQDCHSPYASFLRFSYLPKAMWCCEVCRAGYRAGHEKAERLEKELRDRIRAANKSLREEAEQRRRLRDEANAIIFE